MALADDLNLRERFGIGLGTLWGGHPVAGEHVKGREGAHKETALWPAPETPSEVQDAAAAGGGPLTRSLTAEAALEGLSISGAGGGSGSDEAPAASRGARPAAAPALPSSAPALSEEATAAVASLVERYRAVMAASGHGDASAPGAAQPPAPGGAGWPSAGPGPGPQPLPNAPAPFRPMLSGVPGLQLSLGWTFDSGSGLQGGGAAGGSGLQGLAPAGPLASEARGAPLAALANPWITAAGQDRAGALPSAGPMGLVPCLGSLGNLAPPAGAVPDLTSCCTQMLCPQLDAIVLALLHQLRAVERNSRGGGGGGGGLDALACGRLLPARFAGRRLVGGMREVRKAVRSGAAYAVISAVDIQEENLFARCHSRPGDALRAIASMAAGAGTPVVYAQSRLGLGSVFGVGKRMSSIAIVDATGFEAVLGTILQMAAAGRARYAELRLQALGL